MMDLHNRSALYKIAEPVELDENIDYLLNTMWNIMRDNNGVGLAAPQIGESKRVIIMNTGSLRLTIINPFIIKRKGKTKSIEGCLSFPGIKKTIERDKLITVIGFNQHWVPIKWKLGRLDSFIIQHEIDHLNGITIPTK